MGITGTVTLRIKDARQLLEDKGLDPGGDVQRFHTQNVLRRIQKYMPYRTGTTIKLTIAQTDVNQPYIVTNTPYARYLYYGKAMAGRAPRTATERALVYTRSKHPLAGPYWDRALVAAEMPILQRELQAYINKKGGGGR